MFNLLFCYTRLNIDIETKKIEPRKPLGSRIEEIQFDYLYKPSLRIIYKTLYNV